MGSSDWLKTIVNGKKVKTEKSKKSKISSASEKPTGSKSEKNSRRNKANGARTQPSEVVAATRIQAAFRAYMARKVVRRMKGVQRFKKLTEAKSVKKQSTSTLAHLHLWSRIQADVRDRRQSMVIEGRLKQKELENRIKLEAKLHDLDVEWNGGSETMKEILARVHQREEAAVKRERALAYAFSHQWRQNSSQNQGTDASELGEAVWGWSWKDHWITACPWENRVPSQCLTPKKCHNRPKTKAEKSVSPLATPKSFPSKTCLLNGKPPVKPRRLSFPGVEKKDSNIKFQQGEVKKRASVS